MITENEILECITRYEQKLNNTSFYVGKKIPEKKIKNAVRAYGNPGIRSVLALYDGTIFGSAKEGFLLTERSVCFRYLSGKWTVDYDDIDHLEIIAKNADMPEPEKDILHIFTGNADYRIEIDPLDKRYLLAMLEDICGIGSAGSGKRFDISGYMEPGVSGNGGAATMESKYFQRHRCIYCNSRTTTRGGEVVCGSCNRVNKPMGPISMLRFDTIPEEYLTLLRAKVPGFLDEDIHEEMLSAANEGRLKIAAAVSDGYYSSRTHYDSGDSEDNQFIRTTDGIPVDGRFDIYPMVEEGRPVWVVRLEKRNGKKCYTLLEKGRYERLAETLTEIEGDLLRMDRYEPKERSEGL